MDMEKEIKTMKNMLLYLIKKIDTNATFDRFEEKEKDKEDSEELHKAMECHKG